MKFQLALALVTIASVFAATPDGKLATEIQECGAAGSCEGPGGGDLCNDRCKRCSGPTGMYHRGTLNYKGLHAYFYS
ncbi:hypothetical protein K502DRAFT_353612 [Neoconidiobolus thromboides FSU 785]|nr:hypothetical protein K502DRAFT_353612 [Neoconidiobolus thromboides FSU 785]